MMRKHWPTKWLAFSGWIAASLLASSGCSMCSREYMWDYAGVGGKWQRSNPTCGRVGSNLSDAGAYQNGSSVEFGANYGESWNLIEPSDQSVTAEAQIIDGQLFEDADTPPSGSILIQP